MGNNWTSKVAVGAGAFVALSTGLVTFGGSAEIDPNAAYAEVLAARSEAADYNRPAAPAVGELAGFHAAPAAPLGEVAGRTALEQRQMLNLAVGRNVVSHLGDALTDTFRRSLTDLDLALCPCSDRDAVELAMVSKVDFALIGGTLSDRDRRAGLRQTRIGFELFGLAVPADSPVRSLTSQQVRQVLTGQARNWNELGYDLGPIRLFAPRDQALRERFARTMIKGDAIHDGAELAADDDAVVATVRSVAGSIGAVRVREDAPDQRVRLLQIDWIPATADSFMNQAYPYGIPVQMITAGNPDARAQRFLDFAASDDGREVLSRNLIVR